MYTAPTFTFRHLLLSALVFIGSIIALAYVIYQARFLITGPLVRLEPTATNAYNERVVRLTGNATNITRLWLNDRPIYTDRAGHFNEALILENGYTIATLRAEDRYGRTTRIEREFVFVPATFIQ